MYKWYMTWSDAQRVQRLTEGKIIRKVEDGDEKKDDFN